MQEISQQELLERAESEEVQPFAVFLYTPFCGTCKVTERMLEVILAMRPDLPLYKSNINFLPQVSQEWRITSVPCIVVIGSGEEKQFIYRMQSVDALYRRLISLIIR